MDIASIRNGRVHEPGRASNFNSTGASLRLLGVYFWSYILLTGEEQKEPAKIVKKVVFMLIELIFTTFVLSWLGRRTPASTGDGRSAVGERSLGQRVDLRFSHGRGAMSKRATQQRTRQTNGGARRWTIRKDSTITSFKMALSQHTARKPGWYALWPFRPSERGL